jgi:hypothetical protein
MVSIIKFTIKIPFGYIILSTITIRDSKLKMSDKEIKITKIPSLVLGEMEGWNF